MDPGHFPPEKAKIAILAIFDHFPQPSPTGPKNIRLLVFGQKSDFLGSETYSKRQKYHF